MKIIQLPDVLHEYLTNLVEAHGARGIHPEEGLALNRLYLAVKAAQHIPDEEIARMAEAGAEPKPERGVEVPSHVDGKPIKVECAECYNEEGSYNCIRPAHKNVAKA
jgi:hypothetical protein